MTAAQQAIFDKYAVDQAIPFLDFGNKYTISGASVDPTAVQHMFQPLTWSQIAAMLSHPRGAGQAILGAANYITAAICQLTGDQPATACTPTVRSLRLGGGAAAQRRTMLAILPGTMTRRATSSPG